MPPTAGTTRLETLPIPTRTRGLAESAASGCCPWFGRSSLLGELGSRKYLAKRLQLPPRLEHLLLCKRKARKIKRGDSCVGSVFRGFSDLQSRMNRTFDQMLANFARKAGRRLEGVKPSGRRP